MKKDFVAWLRATGKAKASAIKAEIAEILRDARDSGKLIRDHAEYEDAQEIIISAFTRELRKF